MRDDHSDLSGLALGCTHVCFMLYIINCLNSKGFIYFGLRVQDQTQHGSISGPAEGHPGTVWSLAQNCDH